MDGKRFGCVSLFGESHSAELGAVVEGVPESLSLEAEDFLEDIRRRRSGAPGTTPRQEEDRPTIGRDGTTVRITFSNSDRREEDYALFCDTPRPGHADYVCLKKYGRTFPGGGIFSGRMTLPLVAAGVVCKKMLPGISFKAHLVEVGGCSNPYEWDDHISAALREGDSLGGIVECTIEGVKAGTGEPFWDSVESVISHAVFSIPGVRGIEFGEGFAAAEMKGSEHNDPFGPLGVIEKNGAGGCNGGITNGQPIVFRVAFKPTSSIRKAQRTWSFSREEMTSLEIPGRHDVCFALRTPPVVEAAAAIALCNLIVER